MVNSDKSVTRPGLVGRYLTVLDLKTSCWALSVSVQWTMKICRDLCIPPPMRNCQFLPNRCHLNLDDLTPSLSVVSRNKISTGTSVQQADVPTQFDPD